MRIGPFEITLRRKAIPGTMQNVPGSGGWYRIIREPFGGAWQRNLSETPQNVLAFSAVYACVTLIASDIAKLRIKLVQQNDATGIWSEIENPAFSPFLRKPNHYQNRIEFFESWMLSKLIHGNTYALKMRDRRGLVVAGYVLDPTRVQVKVAPDSSVFYALSNDPLSGLPQSVVVPASEIFHDKCATLYHPLVGISPLSACGRSAMLALNAQQNSTDLFANGSIPSGVLTSAQPITAELQKELQDAWQVNFTGENFGRVAVLGAGLEYKPLSFINPHDAQLIEQLKWSGEDVCRAFHVPAYKVGLGPAPAQHTVEMLNQEYYAQCLQNPIEKIELALDEGLGLAPDKVDGRRLGTEFDIDDLLRMDTATQINVAAVGVQRAIFTPNEARSLFGLAPVPGGETPYMQEQNWPLRDLADRPLPDRPITEPAQLPNPADQSDEAQKSAYKAALSESINAKGWSCGLFGGWHGVSAHP